MIFLTFESRVSLTIYDINCYFLFFFILWVKILRQLVCIYHFFSETTSFSVKSIGMGGQNDIKNPYQYYLFYYLFYFIFSIDIRER